MRFVGVKPLSPTYIHSYLNFVFSSHVSCGLPQLFRGIALKNEGGTGKKKPWLPFYVLLWYGLRTLDIVKEGSRRKGLHTWLVCVILSNPAEGRPSSYGHFSSLSLPFLWAWANSTMMTTELPTSTYSSSDFSFSQKIVYYTGHPLSHSTPPLLLGSVRSNQYLDKGPTRLSSPPPPPYCALYSNTRHSLFFFKEIRFQVRPRKLRGVPSSARTIGDFHFKK